MLQFSLIDGAFVAAISFLVWQYEQRKQVVSGKTDSAAKEKTRTDSRKGGGADPLLTNAMELELIKRSVRLPDRSEPPYSTDPSAYHAELKTLLDGSSALSQSLQPTDPKKFDIAVPDSARTTGHIIMDMVQFQRPRVEPLPPPPCEHMDF
jgi:hypothetical protein